MAKKRDRAEVKSRAARADDPRARRPQGDGAPTPPAHEESAQNSQTQNDRAENSARGRVKLTPRRRLLYLSLPYLAVALLLALVEVGVRLVLPRVSPLEALVEAQRTQSNFTDRERVTIFEGDPLLYWRVKPNLRRAVWDFTLVSTNAEGLRHEGDVGRKEPGTFRVVCVGDSVTFGYRVPVVWADKPDAYNPDWLPYPMLLEKALRAANPGRKIEVIALAVPGYTSYQGLAWLRRDIDWLEPDVVTACFGWNDIGLRSLPDRELMPDDWKHLTYRRALSHSQTLAHLSLWMQRRRSSKEPPRPATTPRVPQDEFASNMIEIARLAAGRGARVVLLGTVYRDAATNPGEAARVKSHRDALRAAANSQGIPYLEIPELTEAANSQKLFGELIHPNHEGHRLMALSLLKFFAAYNTLKGLNVPQGL
ncbi:MAG: SGNH/GDSL hydrolase family protein [Acidobacteria bacterium]|nr:SGNH/GDSL hydrolase family protein [Acidobacteriota bacterium]MCA1641005.1 SGNH/GDSL hydrolase family protein [Acidobacteriota bacterium]